MSRGPAPNQSSRAPRTRHRRTRPINAFGALHRASTNLPETAVIRTGRHPRWRRQADPGHFEYSSLIAPRGAKAGPAPARFARAGSEDRSITELSPLTRRYAAESAQDGDSGPAAHDPAGDRSATARCCTAPPAPGTGATTARLGPTRAFRPARALETGSLRAVTRIRWAVGSTHRGAIIHVIECAAGWERADQPRQTRHELVRSGGGRRIDRAIRGKRNTSWSDQGVSGELTALFAANATRAARGTAGWRVDRAIRGKRDTGGPRHGRLSS